MFGIAVFLNFLQQYKHSGLYLFKNIHQEGMKIDAAAVENSMNDPQTLKTEL